MLVSFESCKNGNGTMWRCNHIGIPKKNHTQASTAEALQTPFQRKKPSSSRHRNQRPACHEHHTTRRSNPRLVGCPASSTEREPLRGTYARHPPCRGGPHLHTPQGGGEAEMRPAQEWTWVCAQRLGGLLMGRFSEPPTPPTSGPRRPRRGKRSALEPVDALSKICSEFLEPGTRPISCSLGD